MVRATRFDERPRDIVLVDTAVHRLPEVDVAPPGHSIAFSWTPVAGATAAEVTSAEAEIGPAVVEEVLGDLAVSGSGSHRVISVPAGKRIRRLTLHGLKAADGTYLPSEQALRARGLRIVVTLPDGGGWTPPLYSVPAVPRRGLIPAALTGASFAAGVLSLPGVAASRVRLTLASGDFPEEFAPEATWSLERVSGVAALPSRDLQLVGPAGSVWAFPGELPPESPSVSVDLRFALEQAFGEAVAAGEAVDTVLRLQGAAPTRAGLAVSTPRGALVRAFPGVIRAELAGDLAAPALDGPPLAAELPSSAVADLTLRYQGIRILEGVSDAVPAAPGGIGGAVVTGRAVVRSLPAELRPPPIARVGVIGRAPVDCELRVELVHMTTGAAIGRPGVGQVPASDHIATVWVEMPATALPNVPLGISVQANRGRFLWAGDPKPLLRLAVRDPDPGGRPLRWGGQTIAAVSAERLELPAQSLPVSAFRSATPVFESELFLTVDIADLTLRYAR